ncbi:uroporphyrinogen-III synthase [Arthrobacter sp. KK5.5]|uniref:uroporphyrinogen-III synthase n=1 Tax=Arthrobacter sp. KK5.5 TaxID=3373084 RepID=UPI003EE5B27E
MVGSGVLAGRTAAVLRAPGRAGGIVAELRSRGASAVLCPLIDFELPADTVALDDSVRALLGGEFTWMVLTSRTTVAALLHRCRALGLSLSVPAHTRIAVVGDATRRAAEDAGLRVDLVPDADHSAEGILEAWPSGTGGVAYLPQADIASPTLDDGLGARGWRTRPVTAYRTVDAPADPTRRLADEAAPDHDGVVGSHTATPSATAPPGGRAAVVLDSGRLAELLSGAPESGLGAVFLTSPSIARRFHTLVPAPDGSVAVVAIGRSTAAEAHRLGLPVSATAELPTPVGLCDAWEGALRGSVPAMDCAPAHAPQPAPIPPKKEPM